MATKKKAPAKKTKPPKAKSVRKPIAKAPAKPTSRPAAAPKRAPQWTPTNLSGKVALVAGATRGAGRGIALALGEAGAIVYCTGRSIRGAPATKGRTETVDETAEMVNARGGAGIPMRVDHTDEPQVRSLIDQIKMEHGRLDILVNDIWGGDPLTEFGTPFWALDLEKGLYMLRQAINSHIITSRLAAPLMLEKGRGLIVEITDGDFYGYRGNLFYDLVKTSVIRLAFTMAFELRRRNIAAVALTPGYLRSEAMLDHYGVTEANWKDGAKKDPNFIASETPLYVGRAVAALVSDPKIMKKSGRVFSSWDLAEQYGFPDADGRKPNWGKHYLAKVGPPYKKCDDGFYKYWFGGPIEIMFPNWP